MTAALLRRREIRALTDALPKGQWLRLPQILDGLSEPKPSRGYVAVELTNMHEAKMLKRRGTQRRYEYRSGPEPVIDRRELLKGKKRKAPGGAMGFRELARLAESDPRAFEEHTRNDGAAWGQRGEST
jgi:hypothetical protein